MYQTSIHFKELNIDPTSDYWFLGDHWIENATEGENGNVRGKGKGRDWIGIAVAAVCDHLRCAEHPIGAGMYNFVYFMILSLHYLHKKLFRQSPAQKSGEVSS